MASDGILIPVTPAKEWWQASPPVKVRLLKASDPRVLEVPEELRRYTKLYENANASSPSDLLAAVVDGKGKLDDDDRPTLQQLLKVLSRHTKLLHLHLVNGHWYRDDLLAVRSSWPDLVKLDARENVK